MKAMTKKSAYYVSLDFLERFFSLQVLIEQKENTTIYDRARIGREGQEG